MAYERRDFSQYSTDIVNSLLHDLTVSAGAAVSVQATFHRLPQSAVDVVFHPENRIEFRVPTDFQSLERRNFFTNRWVCSWPMFAAVKCRYPDLVGECRLWVDDYPEGPGLAFCGNTVSHLLVPDSVFFETSGYASMRVDLQNQFVAWDERQDKVFWRGTSTGSRQLLRLQRWQDIPRFRLCLMARQLNRETDFDVGLSQIVQIWDQQEVADIVAAGLVLDEAPLLRFMNYKYSIDIDGNTCSWPGLFTKLLMGITTVKVDSAMGYRQWYYDRLIPWKNFVPLTVAMTELPEILAWLRANPAEARMIAQRGLELSQRMTMENVMNDMIPRVYEMVSR